MRTLLIGLAFMVLVSGCAANINRVGCVSFDNSTCADESAYVQGENASDVARMIVYAAVCVSDIATQNAMPCQSLGY